MFKHLMPDICEITLLQYSCTKNFLIGKAMNNKFALIVAWIVGLCAFTGWMSLVTPEVVETIIGLLLSAGLGLVVYGNLIPKESSL